MTQLDLSFNADLSEKHSEIFSSLAREKVTEFNKLINAYIQILIKNIFFYG